MVASAHNLDDPTAGHPANVNGDRQQQQQREEKHGHVYRSAQQTAQDKRSRLSNVINNLRKKVPDSRNGESAGKKEEDDRNSVERNLETLEKYVMTVLNGVIKDEENDREVSKKKEAEKKKEGDKLAEDREEDEDPKGLAAKFEPSKPNESRTEAAVFLADKPDKPDKEFSLELRKIDARGENSSRSEESVCAAWKEKSQEKSVLLLSEDASGKEKEPSKRGEEEDNVCIGNDKCSPCKEIKCEEQSVQEAGRNDNQEEERRENRSLGTIIMERLSENLSDGGNVEGSLVDDAKDDELVSDNVELRNVCRDLLNDLLNDINQLIDENRRSKEETKARLEGIEESKDSSRIQDFAMTSLHCSLPLDKVASVLQNCQTSELAAPQSPCSSSSSSSSSPRYLTSNVPRHCDTAPLSSQRNVSRPIFRVISPRKSAP